LSPSRRVAKYPSGTPRSPFRCVQAGPRRLAQELEEASAEPKQFALASRPMRQTPSGRRWTSALGPNRCGIPPGPDEGPVGLPRPAAANGFSDHIRGHGHGHTKSPHEVSPRGLPTRPAHRISRSVLATGSRNQLSLTVLATKFRYQVSRIAYQWPETRRHDMSKPRSSAGPSSIHPQNPASRKPLSSIANRIDSTTR
jgi:hypothetical protein